MVLDDYGILSVSRKSIQWRQLIIFNMNYQELTDILHTIPELTEFDLPTTYKVTSELPHREFLPLTNAIYCPWIDKETYTHFNVGYNATTNKCVITSFRPGEKIEAKLFIKIANRIPCFYMDGTFGPNEMVFLSPKDYKDNVKVSYRIIESNGEEHEVGQMISGRYFLDDTLLNADYVKNCLLLSDKDKKEWIRKHTTKDLDVETYINNQTNRFNDRVKKYKKFKEE